MKLHLGCGSRDFGSDWIHIDGDNYPHLHSNNIKKLPFVNDYADLIYSSHTFEYFDINERSEILKEWKRVLKPKGILRLAVPDFHTICNLYIQGKCSLEDILGPIYGIWKMGKETIQHKTAYDFITLKKTLKDAGFRNIKRYNWRNTEHSNFDDHSRAHLPHDPKILDSGKFTDKHTLISLNIEARK